jgi:competence protein ComEC
MNTVWRYRSYLLVFVLVLACCAVWVGVASATPSGKLKVAVMDVGQGDSIYVESPTGVEVLVDSGPDDTVLQDLPAVMPFFDRSLDAVVETHPDADHIAGFVDLLKRYSVGDFIEPGITKDTITAKTLEKEIDQEKIPRVIARRGMWLDLGGGARLNVLFPDYDVTHINQDADNDGGIVAHLVYGNTSVLLMADVSNVVENHLMQVASTSELQSTILKVGHHGSKTSTGDAFVAEVSPSVAVISDGRHNKYGFPKQETLDTLAKHNVQTLRTDQEGTIEFESDGNSFTRVK